MKTRKTIFLVLLLLQIICFAQNPSCPNALVYMDGGSWISAYDPSIPLSSTNPAATTIPAFGSGLTLMPNINGGTLSPTFYSVSGGTYWYWNGVAWTNTGHSTGNGAAVNLAGCNGTLYNIVGSTGQIYSYNGTGAGSLLTTLSGFNGGGPYDLVTDCNCNFYALNTTTPNQGLSMYSPSGALQCTYTLSGMPNATAGGGFAIIGNMIYVKNNTNPGFYIGTISGGSVTFTSVTGFNNSPGDFASCSICYPSNSLVGATISAGTLGCLVPTVNIVATTTVSPVTYSWSGPGILGQATGSVITANLPGTYSCVIATAGCPPSLTTLTTSVISNSIPVMASLTPSGNICVDVNTTTHLSVAHSSTTDIILWNGPGIPLFLGMDTLSVTLPGTYTVFVTDLFTGCQAKDVVTINQTPTVSIALSDNTVCLHSYNGSPASITITPSGALSYTLYTSSNYSTSSPNGTVMPCYPTTLAGNLSPFATGTVIGSNGTCPDTVTTAFSIIPNPSILLPITSGSICPGGSKFFSVSGAVNYLWGGSSGLNTYSGPGVIASPTSSSVYSVMGTGSGCQSQTQTVSIVVLPLPLVNISPNTSTICLGTVATLTASGSASSYLWAQATGFLSSQNAATVNVSPPHTIIYSVIGSLNTCTDIATATVNIVQPPSLSLTLSSSTLCAQNYNNSPNFITMAASGASNYTILANNNISISSPNGPVTQVIHSGQPLSVPSLITTTLIGQSGVCTIAITKTLMVLPNPVLSISPPSASVCPGNTQVFVASGASNYTWLAMPNYTLTGNNSIVANPTLTSFYSVIGSAGGCKSDLKSGVLIVLPVPEFSVSPLTSTVCAGNSVTLTASGNAVNYIWSPSSSLSNGFGSQVTATPLTLQTYTVKGTLNTCSNQAVATVSVIVVPVLHASSPNPTICSSSNAYLYVTGANSFFWFPTENLNTSSGSAIIASPLTNTTYTVKGYNGICTGSTTIYVHAIKRPDMEIIAETNQICTGSSIPLTATGAETYTWLTAGGLMSPQTNTTVIVAPRVTTNYTVIGSNSVGSVSCNQQLSYSVVVVPIAQPKVSDNVYLCAGEKITLLASGGSTYSWTPSYGLNITNGAGVVANPSITTLYTVDVSYNTYCGKTATVMVSVNPKPSVIAGPDTTYNLTDAIFINAKGTGSLTWVSGENIACADCPLTQIFPNRSGCYVVEAINDYGCKVTDVVCIELTEDFSVYIPNSFSPNNDGLNDVFLIYGENISQVSMEVYNRWGVRIFYSEDFYSGWDGKWKDEVCPVGVYTYIIRYTGLNRKKYTKNGSINLMR